MTIPRRDQPSGRQRQFQAGLRLVQHGRSTWSTAGRTGSSSGHGRRYPVRRPDAAAQGTRRRHRLPLDAGSRPDALRRRPREDEHLRHSGHLRRGRQERMVPRLERVGSSSATMSSCRTTRSSATASWTETRSSSTTSCTRSATSRCPDNQLYWTKRWSDQMNYRYWKERCQAELTTNGVLARQLFYEGTVAYKTGDFPKAADKFKEGLEVWKAVDERFPDLSRRRAEQEGHRPDRQAVRAGAQAEPRRRFPTTCRSRNTCRWPRTTTRSTRSTRSR